MRLAIHQSIPKTLNDVIEKGLQMEAWQIAEDKKHGGTKIRLAVEGSTSQNGWMICKRRRERSNVSTKARRATSPGNVEYPVRKMTTATEK